MSNTDLLENMACPNCGQDKALWVEVATVYTVRDDSAECKHDLIDNMSDDDYTTCPRCEYGGRWHKFYIPSQKKEDQHGQV
jgi:DNA-directed RNA polymerase subunit RPC12/RpoP